MLRRLVEWLAARLGLIVVDADDLPKPHEVKADMMLESMRREVDRAHLNTAQAFKDYEHRIEHLTLEVARLKRELSQK